MNGGNTQSENAEAVEPVEEKAQAAPTEQRKTNQALPPHNVMADVIARHEAAVYRIKKR